jgi:RNA polymerase sigma-70 factor (sigma-E family)
VSRVEDDFVEYARVAGPRLRRTAFLLCRDWELAQDFTQTTLAKMYVHWRRISRKDNPHAYAKKVLSRVFFDHQRLRSSHEVVLAEFPDAAGPGADTELRMTLIDALARIPYRDRAIVVLRYWEDLSIDAVAEILEMPAGTVKSQSARTLARLRDMLGGDALSMVDAHGSQAVA